MVFNIGVYVGSVVGAAVESGSAGGAGLDVAVQSIKDVIATIQTEQDQLKPAGFAFGALIAPSSFGGPDSAPNLGLHYTRAHEVIWKTLDGIKQDLMSFQEACESAMIEIERADDEAGQRARSIEQATETITVGAAGRRSVEDHQSAQQNQDVDGRNE